MSEHAERFTALQSGEIDLLARNTTWTLTRDTTLGLTFAGVNFYDGQAFLVQKKLGIDSARLTTDSGIDLVMYVPGHHTAATIQVKANVAPKPAGSAARPPRGEELHEQGRALVPADAGAHQAAPQPAVPVDHQHAGSRRMPQPLLARAQPAAAGQQQVDAAAL